MVYKDVKIGIWAYNPVFITYYGKLINKENEIESEGAHHKHAEQWTDKWHDVSCIIYKTHNKIMVTAN